MKRIVFLLMALLPTMLWAGGSGSLFVNNKNGLTNIRKDFYYLGKTYEAHRMEGDKNCYYYMDNSTNTKYLFMDKASIRFIQGTKSMTDLIIVVRGYCQVECDNHSCIGLERGSLTIDSEDGYMSTIKISQIGDYRCIYATNGSITLGQININCWTYNEKKACISQEGTNGYLSLNGTHLNTQSYQRAGGKGKNGTWIYAKGIKTRECGFANDNTRYTFNPSTGYLYANGTKAKNLEFVCLRDDVDYRMIDTSRSNEAIAAEPLVRFPDGYALGTIAAYHNGPYHTASFQIDGRSQMCYMLESSRTTIVKGPVYFCPTAKCFVLGDGSLTSNRGDKIDLFTVPKKAPVRVFVVGSATIDNRTYDDAQLKFGSSYSDLSICGLANLANPSSSLTVTDHIHDSYTTKTPAVDYYFDNTMTISDIDITHPEGVVFESNESSKGELNINRSSVTSKNDTPPIFFFVRSFNTNGCGMYNAFNPNIQFRPARPGSAKLVFGANDPPFRITRTNYTEMHQKYTL